jgi:hypothetical protein
LSGKRQSIDGNHLITMPEILGSIKEAGEVTQTRQQGRGGKSKKLGLRVKKEVSEESSD